MKNKRQASSGRIADADAVESKKPARAGNHSVLIQRAVLFTAGVFLAAVIVGAPAYHLSERLGAGRWAGSIGLAAGFIAACAAAFPLCKWLLMKSVKQVSALRDVATRVAGGDFDAHADENAPDELGELGRALNNLSYQLSRNMYMLIVERNRHYRHRRRRADHAHEPRDFRHVRTEPRIGGSAGSAHEICAGQDCVGGLRRGHQIGRGRHAQYHQPGHDYPAHDHAHCG